ncbi:MAG TPA: tripartite tricarboxylate transporter substrate binding protein [Ramlibacter sp.]|nr:tripartite tricarboxylate transporter substrate binding protein [Ramlibacter sp.]
MANALSACHRPAPRALACALALAAALCGSAAFAAFPDKPVTLIAPFPPGGAADTLGRIVARGMAQRLGQPMVVDNKAGAGTAIGASYVAQQAPNGYTLLISSNTTFTVNPAIKSKLPYDPIKSFESVGVIGKLPLVLLAHPSVPVKSVKDVVALAKAQPGKLSYASFGAATTSHFAGEMFKVMAGADILHVPYKGSGPAMTDLIGGQVQLSFDTNLAALPQVQAGKVKVLAVTSAQRSRSMPTVPTIAESGYPGYEMVSWITLVGPRGLPADVSKTLSKALADTVADPAIRAELEKAGLDTAYEPGSAFDARVAKELPLLRAYVHKARIPMD